MQRFVLGPAFLLAALAGFAQSPPFVMVNAAGYGTASAPEGLATIFGTGLSIATAGAALDANGELPTELAATRVEIAGVPARLFYVSPTQINLVVPAGVSLGTVEVVVKSSTSGVSKSATALLRAAAPGVFTSDNSGTGAGAMLNAVTFRPPPFLVQTAENGADTRTRIAVYCTGLRNAAAVTAGVQDPAGNRYPLTVEYAGAAPGFIGLDQVNLLLPADLDGAGNVTLLLTADGNSANPVTFQMALIPVTSLQLTSIAVAPAYLNAGESATVTLRLNGVARGGGYRVALQSDAAAAQVPASVIVPEGKASANATLNTLTVPASVSPTISASASGLTLSTSIHIDAPNTVTLTHLSLSNASILGGRSLSGTVSLSAAAPAGGVNVRIVSDSDAARPPSVVAVPFGRASADFTIPTVAVTEPRASTITASLGASSAAAKLNVLPPLQFTIDQDSVVGGNSVTGTIALGEAPPVTGGLIQFQSSDSTVVRPPAAINIPSNQLSQTLTIGTGPVTLTRVVVLTATYGAYKQSVSLTVNPPEPATLASFTIAPNPVSAGSTAQGVVTLTSAPTVARVVSLTSNSAIASVPGFVTIQPGQTSATFNVITSRSPGTATITASVLGVTKSVILTVR